MGQSILLNDSVFDESYLPEKLVCRENHISEIERFLLPAKQGRSIKNLYVFGPTGSGKTLAVKHVLRKHFGKNSVYVNCWSSRTTHKVMEGILKKLGHVIHGRESTSALIKKFDVPERKKDVVICLDEVDQLKDNKRILYVLARNSSGLVLISNLPFSRLEMDSRIKSRLFLQDVEFAPYQNHEVFDILKNRAFHGLNPQTINDQILSEIAEICNGDARIGLNILRAAAEGAESGQIDSITSEMIKSVGKSSQKYRLSYLKGKLNEHQRILYELLRERKTMSSGELYRNYTKSVSSHVTSRGYRKYMRRMVDLGLVREIGSKRWKKYEVLI